MKKRKKKQVKPVYLAVRGTWTRNPVTRIKSNGKAVAIKKACRGRIRPGAGACVGIAA